MFVLLRQSITSISKGLDVLLVQKTVKYEKYAGQNRVKSSQKSWDPSTSKTPSGQWAFFTWFRPSPFCSGRLKGSHGAWLQRVEMQVNGIPDDATVDG